MVDNDIKATVAEALACPIEAVTSLVKDPSEAQAILEVAMLGRLIQDLLYLQSLHSGCNVSDLQKVSNLILSSSDTRVTSSGAPSILMKVADALKKSVEAISESVTSCFAAIEKLSRLLTQHAEKNGAIALELQRKPRCQELSIEKHLLSRIQEELAKRAEFIARNRGIINSAPQNNRPFSAVVDILKSSAAAELEVLAASTSNGHHEASYLGEYAGDTIAALREEVRVLNRGMQVMAGQLHQFQQQQQQQQPSFHKPTLNRSNYLAPARPQIIPIEQNAREGDGFKLTGVQPHGTLSIRELLPECKENAQADHTKDRALRGDAAPSSSTRTTTNTATDSQPRQSSPTNPSKSVSKSVKSNEREPVPPEFCFPTHRLDRAPGVEDYVCRASPPQKHFEVEEKEIDATQSIEDLEEDDGEGEDDVPKTQRAGYEQQAEIVLQEGAPDHEGAATPSVVPATNGPAQLAPLRPTKGGWWSSQKDSTSPHSGDNNRNSKEDGSKGTSKDTSGHGREGYEMPEAKRVRREEVVPSSPEAQRPMHQQIHQQGTQQSGGIFTPATYALKLSQKSLGYPSASAPPSSARVAGAAKGATPMFVSLDPPYDRTEHGISPPPPCGTGVSIYKRDLT